MPNGSAGSRSPWSPDEGASGGVIAHPIVGATCDGQRDGPETPTSRPWGEAIASEARGTRQSRSGAGPYCLGPPSAAAIASGCRGGRDGACWGHDRGRAGPLRRVLDVPRERGRVRPALRRPAHRAPRVGGGRAGPPPQRAGVGHRRAGAGVPARWGPERPHLGHRGAGPRPAAGGHRPARATATPTAGGRACDRSRGNAQDVATVVRALAPRRPGGRRACRSAGSPRWRWPSTRPSWCARSCWWTSRPGSTGRRPGSIIAFVNGPESFDSFDDLLARTVAFNPTRSESSLRRGILHNAVQRDDGTWVWRHARHRRPLRGRGRRGRRSHRLRRPVGRRVGAHRAGDAGPGHAAAVGRVRRRRGRAGAPRPDARVEHVEEAGHSVQGDTPVELAALIDDFVP